MLHNQCSSFQNIHLHCRLDPHWLTAAPSNRLSAHSETQRCVCLCPGEVSLAGREPVALQAWHWSSAHGSGWRSRLPPEAPGLRPAPGRAEPRPSADPAWCRPTPGSCWTRRDPWRSMAVGVREWDAALRRGTATPPSPPHTSSKPAPRSSPPETDHCTDGNQQRLTREIWAGQPLRVSLYTLHEVQAEQLSFLLVCLLKTWVLSHLTRA